MLSSLPNNNLLNLFRIQPNLRSTVYCNAIAAGGVNEWEFAWSQFQTATIAIEADKLRYALACAKQPWLLNRFSSQRALILLHFILHSMIDYLMTNTNDPHSFNFTFPGTWSTL